MSDSIYRHDAIKAIETSRFLIDAIEKVMLLPSAQPELAIPLSWIEGQIEWLKSLDNDFSTLTAGQISAMVNKWKDELKEGEEHD